jgi:tRNA(fMet)-specific endonuclease VapC
MRYLLDSNAVISLMRNASSSLARRARQESLHNMALSAIVVHELFYGAFKSSQMIKNVALVDALQFPVLDFSKEDARRAGEVRAFLALKGASIGAYDVLIAGQALARKLILITHNVHEFARVPSLLVEDWQA